MTTNNNTNTTHMATSSPALRGFSGFDHSPSPRQRPSSRMPSSQQFSNAHSMAITPASARSTSSVCPSPYSLSIQNSPLTAYTQESYYTLPPPGPLELPEPVIPPPAQTGNKGSLIRKFSHGAKNVSRELTSQLRRHTSSSNQSRRAESSGPVARRRSDSKTATASSFTVDPDYTVPDLPNGLGLNYTVGYQDDPSLSGEVNSIDEFQTEVIAPSIPKELVAGWILTKSTRRKKVDKLFFLNAEGTRVSWSGAVSTKSLHVDNIKHIDTGKQAMSQWHAVQGDDIDIECCFTITYTSSESSSGTKTLHLIAHSKDDLSLWVDTLDAITKHREDMMTAVTGATERHALLKAHWDLEIKRYAQRGSTLSEGLNLLAISNLCRKLHIHCPKEVIKAAFEKADVRGVSLLDYDQFRSFVKILRERSDIEPIFKQLRARDVDGISRTRFLQFLYEDQGVDLSSEATRSVWENKIEKLISRSICTTASGEQSRDHIDSSTFTAFLSSQDCRIYATTGRSRAILDRPLSEYFISSSHNTYLLGRQVNGTSSVKAYIDALRRGCRSVEIDCWDGENNNPRVTHGFTRTTSVNFEDVCDAINRSAFEASPYPVILSLEVHCNPTQQFRMVEIMNHIFGDRLVLKLLPNHENDLPSPEELMYKILVKVKATEAHPNLQLTPESLTGRKRSTSSPYRRPVPTTSNSSLQQPLTISSQQIMMSPPDSFYSPTTATSASSDDESDINIVSPVTTEPTPRHVKTSKITPPLAAFGTYLQGYTFRNYGDLNFSQFNHIFSLNESTAIQLCKDADLKKRFERHNLKYMCRVYPKGIRVNSSNFDPNTFWRRGVQMVALNCQTYDTHMQMNQAMFAAGTDRSGYVLKPEYLRRQQIGGLPGEYRAKLQRHDIRFSVQIISAQQLPRLASMKSSDGVDPFVEVQMFSAEDKARGIANGTGGEGPSSTNDWHGIGVPYIRRTKVVRGNGYNPQFNDTFELAVRTKYPELVFVRFIVYQAGKNSRQLAVFTAKLDSLQQGYRHIPLYNSQGEECIFSTLFCKIVKCPSVSSPPENDPESNDRTPRQRKLRTILSSNRSVERGRPKMAMAEELSENILRMRLNQEIEAFPAYQK